MLTTAGITFPTARTTGSEAGSVGDEEGNGVGVCAKCKAVFASKMAITSVDVWIQIPGSARNASPARTSRAGFGVSPKQSFLFPACKREVRDGETPSPAREMRALPRSIAFDIVLYYIPSGGMKSPAQITGRLSTVNLPVGSFLRHCLVIMHPSFANRLNLDLLEQNYER